MLEKKDLVEILQPFGLTFSEITTLYDTSRGEKDQRLNYVLDEKYVLKIHSPGSVWEERLREISRLIQRYRSIGVYCPTLIPTLDGSMSRSWELDGKPYTCFVEEYAQYPVCGDAVVLDRKEVVAHLGVLAARYSGVDLSEIRSMWSLIDLAPLDVDIDEKQENTNALVKALQDAGFAELAQKLDEFNDELRAVIRRDYRDLPRCVFQGDLNDGNFLHRDGHFAGLIDFNLSGTDVNINVFVNETNWFPNTGELDAMTVPELLSRIDSGQESLLSVIFESYAMNDLEKRLLPYYKRIADLFQYPDVCAMVSWLKDDARRDKCAELIRALIEKPL
ncbi:MAG: phosphotransferase enzyme family protein [Faecousia sp.]